MKRLHVPGAALLPAAVSLWLRSSAAIAQVPQSGAAPSPPTASSSPVTVFIIVAVVGVIVVLYRRSVDGAQLKHKQSAQRSLLRRQAALDAFQQNLETEYPHVFWSSTRESAMCMDADGQSLRFVRVGLGVDDATAIIEDDVTIPLAAIVSVDLLTHTDRHTESRTIERKKGAIGRAVAGELLFGGVGAIVGSTSANSTIHTVGQERATYVSSELVFGLDDLQSPVLRFISTDPVESDRWLHRVRAAMARRRVGPPPPQQNGRHIS